MEIDVQERQVLNPALKILVPAVVLNGLTIAGFSLAKQPEIAIAILAGCLVPVVISTGSLWLFSYKRELTFRQVQTFMLYSFIAKFILVGLWVVMIVLSRNVMLVPFVISLLINFLAWHLSEAYHIRPLLRHVVSENTEN